MKSSTTVTLMNFNVWSDPASPLLVWRVTASSPHVWCRSTIFLGSKSLDRWFLTPRNGIKPCSKWRRSLACVISRPLTNLVLMSRKSDRTHWTHISPNLCLLRLECNFVWNVGSCCRTRKYCASRTLCARWVPRCSLRWGASGGWPWQRLLRHCYRLLMFYSLSQFLREFKVFSKGFVYLW